MKIEDIVALANALAEADSNVEAADKALKIAKERARVLREEAIPSAMQELGVERLDLENGMKLTIKQDVYAQIPAERKEAAFTWLAENGFGGLIKVDVTSRFGKGDFATAQELAKTLRAQGLDVDLSQNVHAMTLKAFLREQLASASNIPLELFGAHPVWTAKLGSK